MHRLAILSALLLLTTGCFDFAGERGELGFLTDALVGAATKWSPEHPLAEGTIPAIGVGEHLSDGREPERIRLKSSRGVDLVEDDGSVRFQGTSRGWVQADADGVVDWFRVRWEPVDAITFSRVGTDVPLDHALVLDGVDSPVDVALRDRRGRRLGHLQRDLDWEGLVLVDDLFHIPPDSPPWIEVGFADATTTLEVETVSREAVELHVDERQLNGRCFWEATAWFGDEPVLWPGALAWAHTESAEPWVPCGTGQPSVMFAD